MRLIIKQVLKIVTSVKFIELLDKNGDGKVSWEEVKNAPRSVKLEIIGELGWKIALYLLPLLL